MNYTTIEGTSFNLDFVLTLESLESVYSEFLPKVYPGWNDAFKKKCLKEVWERAQKLRTKAPEVKNKPKGNEK